MKYLSSHFVCDLSTCLSHTSSSMNRIFFRPDENGLMRYSNVVDIAYPKVQPRKERWNKLLREIKQRNPVRFCLTQGMVGRNAGVFFCGFNYKGVSSALRRKNSGSFVRPFLTSPFHLNKRNIVPHFVSSCPFQTLPQSYLVGVSDGDDLPPFQLAPNQLWFTGSIFFLTATLSL